MNNKSFIVFFLLGDSSASEFYVSTFRNTRSVPSSPKWNRQITLKLKIRTPGIHPKQRIQYSEQAKNGNQEIID
jgi:hypothetical protein